MARSFDPIQTVNSKVAGNDSVSFLLNELGLHPQGQAMPPGVPHASVPHVGEPEKAGNLTNAGMENVKPQAPLKLKPVGGKPYEFPLDPAIVVTGRNIITRRYVAKGSLRGTVKESWSRDDYEITIIGVLMGSDAEDLNRKVAELKEVCSTGEALDVYNARLQEGYGVNCLVVESCHFPRTKGLNSQGYSLKCYSDDSVKVLEEVQ